MAKKKLAFVDHNYHKKTRSGDFLRDIFSRDFIIDDFWWSLNDETKLYDQLKDYENIFFFQTLIPSYDLLKLKDKNLLWAPMYDNLSFKWSYWKKISYVEIKLLCFSEKVKLQADKFRCPNIKLKYFFDTKKIETNSPREKLNIFFWYRHDLKLIDWINLFDSNMINKIVYFNSPDPGKEYDKIDQSITEKYKIEIITKDFLPHDEYLEHVKKCDVFISPRKQEGIGMSFLEAISMGKYIVSNDDSTMNEYITNQKIGYLINKKDNKKINYDEIINGTEYRESSAKNGYLNWSKQKNNIIDFFLNPLDIKNKNFFTKILFLFDLLKFYLIKIIR